MNYRNKFFYLHKIIKQLLWGALFLVVLLGIVYHDLIGYGIRQGYGQACVLWNARPVEEVLKDTAVHDSLKERLRFIQTVRKYAVEHLGVNNTGNYTSFYDQHGKPVLWVVTACRPFKLQPYSWNFPLLGSVNYKGYFNKSLARKEAKRLKKKGYDTDIRTVEAWSTLGWFNDPVLSGMLDGSKGELAELIIHELTHATLYIPDSTQFNESLATFIGQAGAKHFLKHKYGRQHPEYRNYIRAIKDSERFSDYILTQAKRLDSLYRSNAFKKLDSAEKRKRKRAFIKSIMRGLEQVSFHNRQKYAHLINMTELPENTFFMHYLRYKGNMDKIRNVYKEQFDQDIKTYLTHLKEKYSAL